MNDGGITVTKTTTGSLLLHDIQVMVHHQTATYIPADKALNSADLHRALNSRVIFQMLNTMTTTSAVPVQDVSRSVALEEENRLLREALKKSTQQGSSLQESVEALGAKLETLVAAVGRIQTTPVVIHGGPSASTAFVSEVVGGDVPMFIPDNIVPKGAEVQVQVQETSSDGGAVSEAQSRLRKLRRGQTG